MKPGNKAAVSIISVNIRGVGSPQSSSSPVLRPKFQLFCRSPPSQTNSIPARLVTVCESSSASHSGLFSLAQNTRCSFRETLVPAPYVSALATSLRATRSGSQFCFASRTAKGPGFAGVSIQAHGVSQMCKDCPPSRSAP